MPVLFLSRLPVFIGSGQEIDYIIFCLLVLFPAFAFRWIIFDSILYTLIWYLGVKLSLKFRQILYHKMQLLPLSFYQSRSIGEHLYRANADIDSVVPLLNSGSGLPGLISSLYQTILMAWLVSIAGSEILFYLTLVLIPIYFSVHFLYTIVRRLDFIKRSRAQDVTAVLRESIAGIRVIKAFDRITFAIHRYFHKLARFYRSTQAAYFMQIFADQVRVSPIHILWPLSLPFFAWLAMKEKIPVLTWGSIVFFLRAMLFYLDGTYSFFQRIRLFLVPAERLFDTIDIESEFQEPPNAIRIKNLKGEIEFKNVTFSYQKNQPILKNMSFSIKPGQKLAIVGPSGAGKSTICNLLLRLYLPDSGEINVDGLNLQDVHISSFRSRVGVILQDTFLFDGTIGENVSYANPDSTTESIIEAAKAAGIHEAILEMPGSYAMDVAEGTNISGGQKQRLAIARAFIKNPDILILDEATSSLDPSIENAIFASLQQHFKNRTTIIISHRLRPIIDADEILVIDQGEIVERGRHDQLIQSQNLYYHLFQQELRQSPMQESFK
ncbi:ABC transporter ATP-binding protein [candidate division KSB1 bacterium]|nr:ABC transporter ATP-binding protein [candidate division KSB1 bacterium]